MKRANILVYLIRRDLRVSDNPILHHLASSPDHGFTHLLPVYVLPPPQIEVSGLVKDGARSPYPEARSPVGGFWRCGPHRARIIAESAWNMKDNLTKLGPGMIIRVGTFENIVENLANSLKQNEYNVGAVWMISEEGYEEQLDEKSALKACSRLGVEFKAWTDEKYFVDDRDLKFESPQDLPDIFTTYRKMMEPLREKPRPVLPTPQHGTLPQAVEDSKIPEQEEPFMIPSSYKDFEDALLKPIISALPKIPDVGEVKSAHPLHGGEDSARERLRYVINSGQADMYKTTRNGLLGAEFSTKLSAFLAQGCITAREVHGALVAYEDGNDDQFAEAPGYGQGENEGTKAIRFELLWRDYMRLCSRKFKTKLYQRSGFRDEYSDKWKTAKPANADGEKSKHIEEVSKTIQRVLEGSTGMGLIDASQRELIYTGYTSNRARQNVASFLAKHLEIDWRYGAEWYEMLLVDYDVSSNWANWQYVAGVGNDPRGEARIFNPVKQAFDYDKGGEYVRYWVPEVRELEKLENVFQAWTTPKDDWDKFGLTGLSMVEDPVKKIEFSVEGKPKNSRRPFIRRRGQNRGGGNGGGNGDGNGNGHSNARGNGPRYQSSPNAQQSNGYFANGYGQQRYYNTYDSPGQQRGGYRGRAPNGSYRGRGYAGRGGGSRGGGRGSWQHNYPQAPRHMHQWSQDAPAG